MLRVHILTEGFVSPNGRAFLFPLIVHRQALREAGIHLRCFTAVDETLYDCDVLIVDSKFHKSQWIPDTEGILEEFHKFKQHIGRVLYFDTTDSTGWIQTELLPIVDGYFKGQLLADRSLYLQPMYGHRIYADYYHRKHGVTDAEPEYSTPVEDPALLKKLAVSWNSGLADYSVFGPLRMELYKHLPLRALLRRSQRHVAPSTERPIDLQCRMGTGHSRASVGYQRCLIRELLANQIPTRKVPRRRYLQELARSKIVVSPFGFGEITLKDFEVFLTGGLLLKPSMSHLETWPDLFRSGKTIITHRWDLADFEDVIEEVLSNYVTYQPIAEAGQAAYREHIATNAGSQIFARRFAAIVSGSDRGGGDPGTAGNGDAK